MVFPPVEQHGESDQNPAEAELEVSQDVDREDDGEGLAEFNPHLGDVRESRLRLFVQLFRGQRWADGAHRGAGRCDGPVRPDAGSCRTLHPVTHFPAGKWIFTADLC